MKVFAYSCRSYDEEPIFRRYTAEMGMGFGCTEEAPSFDNLDLAEGSDFVSVLPCRIPRELLDRFRAMGIKLLCTRTVGYDHIDVAYAHEIGLPVAHVTYDVYGVAEYAVMMILMSLRKFGEMEVRNRRNDFTLRGLLGREIGKSTIGIVGTGNVGKHVLKCLSGFGGRLLYFNRSPCPEADRYAERVSLNELLAQCDVVSLHLEHNSETHHIIDADAIASMKEGSILVNTARGPLVDTEAFIAALESGRLGGAAIDVVENELGLYYNDCSGKDLSGHYVGRLRSMPNVIFMHHMGFYYETAITDAIVNSLNEMKAVSEGRTTPMRL